MTADSPSNVTELNTRRPKALALEMAQYRIEMAEIELRAAQIALQQVIERED